MGFARFLFFCLLFLIWIPAWADVEPAGFGDLQHIPEQMFLVGFIMAFAILHLTLYLFDRKTRVNLPWALGLASAAVFVWAISLYEMRSDPVELTGILRVMIASLILAGISACAFLGLLIFRRVLWPVYLLSAAAAGLLIWSSYNPVSAWKLALYFTLAAVAEGFRTILVSWIRKQREWMEGGWVLAVAILPAAGAIFLAGLGALEILELPWQKNGSRYVLFSAIPVVVAMSVYLARRVAKTNRDLEMRLEEVKVLSEENLQKEREKALLHAENARKTEELEQARRLQLSMLPERVPEHPDLRMAAYIRTATEVGGDYYDFKAARDGVLTAVIGDATGHGMQAGTMVATTKGAFGALAEEPHLPTILNRISLEFREMDLQGMNMALAIGRFSAGWIKITSGGMPYPLLYRAASGKAEEVILQGPPLGVLAEFPYEEREILLEPGDTLLFMSDGFPELFSEKREILGFDRVLQIFEEAGGKEPEAVIEHLVQAGTEWAGDRPPDDDITFIVIQRK